MREEGDTSQVNLINLAVVGVTDVAARSASHSGRCSNLTRVLKEALWWLLWGGQTGGEQGRQPGTLHRILLQPWHGGWVPAILKAEPTEAAVVEEVMGFGSGVQADRPRCHCMWESSELGT